jgi:hypothetical protein
VHRRAVQVLHARLGLVSNNGALIRSPEYFTARLQQSLLTDYHAIQEIPYTGDLDAEIFILDEKDAAPRLLLGEDRVVAVGDFTALEARTPDKRYTLFGNLGFLYRYIIYVLEKHHQTYTFHASAMLDDATGELWLIPGAAGAGKTCFLLAGLARDFTVFSTEMTHVRLTDGGTRFFKGSLFDNVRVGNLTHDFPEAAARLGVTLPAVSDVWATKIALDLAPVQAARDILENPPLRIVHPKVESGRATALVTPIEPRERLVRLLFDSATEKHGQTVLLYECLPVPALDEPELARRRLEAIRALVKRAEIRSARATLCGPKNCLEGLA